MSTLSKGYDWNVVTNFPYNKLVYCTLPGTISTVIPTACGITRMSENMIDASKSKRRNGCIVTSQASSGVWHMVKKSFCFRTARYSGKYRPAWRITQTGMRSTVSPLAARSKLSLISGGNSWWSKSFYMDMNCLCGWAVAICLQNVRHRKTCCCINGLIENRTGSRHE